MKRIVLLLLLLILLLFALPGYAEESPQAEAVGEDGVIYSLKQTVYPVGTPYILFTITSPRGIEWYYTPRVIDRWENGEWVEVEDAVKDWEEGVNQDGYFAGTAQIALCLNGEKQLDEGLYRAHILEEYVETEGEEAQTPFDDTGWHYEVVSALEFRVEVGAETPLPVTYDPVYQKADVQIAPHDTPHHAVDTYNSSQDVSRLRVDGTRTLLAIDGTTFELVGNYGDMFDWYPSRYWLFAYPEGQPEKALPVTDELDLENATIYDTGSDLLLKAYRFENYNQYYGYWRMNYDGADLREFPLRMPEDSAKKTNAALLVGDNLYLATEKEIWRVPLDETREAECVYESRARISNSDEGEGFLVCAGGELIFSEQLDNDLKALDLKTLAVRRIVGNYSAAFGESGFGYFVLNERIYLYDYLEHETVSLKLDGTDRQVVSDKPYYVYQVRGGTVLAATGKTGYGFDAGFQSVDFYDAPDPANPTFDPEHGAVRPVEKFDFFLDDCLYHTNVDGSKTVSRIE